MKMYLSKLLNFHQKEFNIIRIITLIYIIGFAVGTTTHTMDILRLGLFGYNHVSLGVNIYWTMLTLLDPLAIVLLLVKPKWGIVLSVVIMVSDLTVNITHTILYYFESGEVVLFHLSFQIIFALILDLDY